MAGTRSEHIDLTVHEVVVNLDCVVVESILVGEFHLELWSHGDIKLEHVWSVLLQVYRLLTLVCHWLAEHLDLVLVYILIELLADDLVDLLSLNALAVLSLYHAHWHLSRTETWQLSLLAKVFQCLLNSVLEICSLHCQGQQSVHLIWILKRNLHFSLFVFYMIIIFLCLYRFIYRRAPATCRLSAASHCPRPFAPSLRPAPVPYEG